MRCNLTPLPCFYWSSISDFDLTYMFRRVVQHNMNQYRCNNEVFCHSFCRWSICTSCDLNTVVEDLEIRKHKYVIKFITWAMQKPWTTEIFAFQFQPHSKLSNQWFWDDYLLLEGKYIILTAVCLLKQLGGSLITFKPAREGSLGCVVFVLCRLIRNKSLFKGTFHIWEDLFHDFCRPLDF